MPCSQIFRPFPHYNGFVCQKIYLLCISRIQTREDGVHCLQMIKSGCKEHWSNDWNKIDMIGCVFFILSFLLRLGGQLDGGLLNGGLLDGGQLNSSQMDSGLLNFARGCYSVAILLLYIRYLQVFVVFKSIGPYVFMVRLAVRMNAQQNTFPHCMYTQHACV